MQAEQIRDIIGELIRAKQVSDENIDVIDWLRLDGRARIGIIQLRFALNYAIDFLSEMDQQLQKGSG